MTWELAAAAYKMASQRRMNFIHRGDSRLNQETLYLKESTQQGWLGLFTLIQYLT